MDKDIGKEEFVGRKNNLLQTMDESGLEGVLVYANMLRRENLRYLTNFNPLQPHALAMFMASGRSLLMVPLEAEVDRAKTTAFADEILSYDGDVTRVSKVLKKLNVRGKLGIAGWEYTPMDLILEVKNTLNPIALVDSTALVHRLRIIKSASEITKIKKAAQIADAAFAYLVDNMKPGLKEYELIAMTEYKIRQACGEDNFQLLASSKGESRAMHPPASKTLNPGDLFLTEISPQFDGYYAQVCRTVVIGEISPERQKAHDILYRAQRRGIEKVRPGMTASELAKIQNDVFREEGFSKYVTEKYTRGRGHGIGLYIDEEPLLAEGNDYELQEGMVLMIHPNTYLPLSGYIVLGDPVQVTAEGGKRLNNSEQELISIQ
jgi:Xaa-Pro aminopeptidase